MKIEEAIKRIEHEMQMNDVMCNSTGIEEDTTAYLENLNEALGMGVEALVETQWISVTDRLPKKTGYYMIYVEGFLPAMSWFDEKCWGLRKVTHWKHLPKAPEV